VFLRWPHTLMYYAEPIEASFGGGPVRTIGTMY